ncbi:MULTISPECIES: polysialyltransferase family glycosyltransferase [unclassified Chitinophaga]|uniref:polysialyltransferase family glycosyltransferase n=1 Tax=unclassified Chitinophaga TaxID=2619133 RepID=UPI00301045D2
MMYVLVNNNYHIDDFEKYRSPDDGQEMVLIRVPHMLNPEGAYLKNFKKVYTFTSSVNGIKSLFYYFRIKKNLAEVRKLIQPVATDTLIFFTDYEILNQFIVKLFKDAGCKVVMLEDGMATVAVGNMTSTGLSLKYAFQKWVLRTIYKFDFMDIIAEKNSLPLPVIKDEYIDAIGLSIKSPFQRNIPVYQLKAKEAPISGLKDDTVIFINQDIYNLPNINFPDYLKYLSEILETLSTNFKNVYFKFHPRETLETRTEIEKITRRFTGVILVDDFKTPVERQVEQLLPKYSTSFYSNSLRSLYFKGIEPFFLYHLIPELKHSSVGQMMDGYLNYIGYNFVANFAGVRAGYHCGLELAENGATLSQLFAAKK